MSRASLPAHRPRRSPDGGKQDRKAGIDMATGKANGIKTAALGMTLALGTVAVLAGCSVQRPGAAEDHSLDTVERNRAAMGVAAADTTYDQAERNRLSFGDQPDSSYDDVERLRAGLIGD